MNKPQAFALAISELHGKPDMLTAIRELRIAQMRAERDEYPVKDYPLTMFVLALAMIGGIGVALQ